MTEPTQQEVQTFTKVEIVAQYCQLDADPFKELCKTLGIKPEEHPCILANIPKADYMALLRQ